MDAMRWGVGTRKRPGSRTILIAAWMVVALSGQATLSIEFVDRYRDDKGTEKASIGGRAQGIEDFGAYKVLIYTTLDNQTWIRAPGQYAPIGVGGTWERSGIRPGKKSRILLVKRGVKVPDKEALTEKELEAIPQEAELTHSW